MHYSFSWGSRYSSDMNLVLPNMSNDACAIRLKNVTKTFPLEKSHATLYRALKKGFLNRFQQSGRFSALTDINLDVLKGEKIGIIGDNGSGKTTLLKIIAGLYKPDTGQLHIQGEVTLLAGLGIGMLDELSVEENLFLYGTIYGLDKRTMAQRLGEIIEWAELREF